MISFTLILVTLLQLSFTLASQAELHAYPYVVDIRHYVGSPHYHWCGGVIINENWILTASNCISKADVIVAGDHDVSTVEGTEQFRGVAFTARHPNYTYPGNSGYNTALVKVDLPFQFNTYVSAITPKSSSMIVAENAAAIAIGWSSESNGGYYQNILQSTTMQVASADGVCNDGWTNADQRFCFTGGDDSCSADVGSPVICDTIDSQRVLCGIANGDVCGSIRVVYRVDIFLDWIMDVIAANNNKK